MVATVWEVPDGDEPTDLYDALSDTIRPSGDDDGRLLIGDSKHVYRSKGGIEPLEFVVLTAMAMRGECPATWRALWRDLAPHVVPCMDHVPWYAKFDATLPIGKHGESFQERALGWRERGERQGVRLHGIAADALFAQQFNDELDQRDNKSDILGQHTLRLVRRVCDQLPRASTWIQCDKLGGRNRYAGLLQSVFDADWVDVLAEGRDVSIYRWGLTECRFTAKGERMLPTALASMTAKYLRETAMMAFNAFWHNHVLGLRPTAGYSTDAHRFRRAIADAQHRLGIGDHTLWRRK